MNKYEIVRHESKTYFYIIDLTKNEQLCDEDGNPYRFHTYREAEDFISDLD